MKYGESAFDVIYLVYAVVIGISILIRCRNSTGRLTGSAVLILGLGDAFHLVPRVLNYFSSGDYSVWLGFGKLVTSITMTVFYLLVYRLWIKAYKEQEDRRLSTVIYALTAIRILLCLLPQNNWLQNESSVNWGIIRNVPFVMLGGLIVNLYYFKREEIRSLRNVWLLISLSFAFYIPVAVAASLVPMLGMLMLPKTVCYMLLVWCFRNYTLTIK